MKKLMIFLVLSSTIWVMSATSADAQVSVGVSISANIAPPPLPVYSQPACPTDGFLWTPGYWAYGDGGYFWVPGVWVRPPQYGFLWTPCYWGFAGGVYGFHQGYWGPHVGFYGGINYGYGYGGSGFGGGRWEGNSFRYNTAVVNVNRTVIHNTYVDRTVVVHNTTAINNRTSFNGGPHGITARPNTQEESAFRERHVNATAEQTSHMQQAGQNRSQFASVNHGQPATTAMNKPGGQAYQAHGNGSSAHAMNNHPAPVNQQMHSDANAHPANASNNHPAPVNQQMHSDANVHPANASNNHPPEMHNPNAGNHQTPANHPAPHQQAYNHPQPQQHNQAPHQQHNPAPQQHAGGSHPKEH